jgi:hypothetical protein
MLIASLDFALHGSCKQLHRRVSFPVAARSHLNKMPCDFTPGNDPHCDIPVIPHSVRQANPPSRSTQSTSRGLLAQDTPQDPDIPSCPLAHRKLTLHWCRHGWRSNQSRELKPTDRGVGSAPRLSVVYEATIGNSGEVCRAPEE